MNRIDVIGQNGNDGEHYLVDKVLQVLLKEPSPHPTVSAIEIIGIVRAWDRIPEVRCPYSTLTGDEE